MVPKFDLNTITYTMLLQANEEYFLPTRALYWTHISIYMWIFFTIMGFIGSFSFCLFYQSIFLLCQRLLFHFLQFCFSEQNFKQSLKGLEKNVTWWWIFQYFNQNNTAWDVCIIEFITCLKLFAFVERHPFLLQIFS